MEKELQKEIEKGTIVKGGIVKIYKTLQEFGFTVDEILMRLEQALWGHKFLLDTEDADTVYHSEDANKDDKYFMCDEYSRNWKEITKEEYLLHNILKGNGLVYTFDKEIVRDMAIEWQSEFESIQYWDVIMDAQAKFEVLGESFGLTEEFIENAII